MTVRPHIERCTREMWVMHITNEIDMLDCLRLRFTGYASRWRLQTCEPGAIAFLT